MSNHLGDTNKMVSETPRTDKEAFFPPEAKYNICDADFARTLERELNAANVEIEEKRKDVVWLATEKAKLEERIKRLEEAGDKLHWAWMNPFDPAGETIVDNWRKSKEAKP